MTKLQHIWPEAIPVLVAIAFLGAVVPVRGQETSSATNEIDVVIVLDDSGSMATCWPWAGPLRSDQCLDSQNPPSDPHDLRYSAARLLVQLAADEDRVAVIRFNAGTESVIGQLQPVGSRNNRQSLVKSIRAPSDYEKAGGYTRIDLGLQHAEEILANAKGAHRPSYILFLTDGVPTQPGDVPKQDRPVKQMMAQLQEMGTQVFPVFLCNEKAGCPDDTFVKETMGRVPEKAKTADDLLQVFSALFAQMKPDLHVIDRRNAQGELEFTTRAAHGARQLIIVAESNGLIALKRDGSPETISYAYQDGNVLVNVLRADRLSPGTWTVETRGQSSFVVAQTETYPELVYPPPSVPGSAAAPHYVPTGKPIAIVAKVVGPGSEEPLRLDGTTPLKPLGSGSPLRWAVLPGGTSHLMLQVGDDAQPLQIQRRFLLEARADLPVALALSPAPGSPCLADGPCTLKAAFGPGAEVEEAQGMVYVVDQSDEDRLVYSAPMTCSGRECADPAQGFKRLDGHTYGVRFLLQARTGDVLFGDWAETTLALEPAVYLRGLPTPLNLKAQPLAGWPVTVTVGTTQDLGQLRATVALTRTNDNTPVSDAQVAFSANIAGAGEQQTILRVELPQGLRPGRYEGQINFAVDNPSVAKDVRLPAPIPVSLSLARPAAEVATTSVDFGRVVFETSPNFRVDQTASVEVQFSEAPFSLAPLLEGSTCPGLELVAGSPEPQGDKYQVPLSLRSSGPVSPQTCLGTFTLRGPSEDYDVQPGKPLSWRLVIPEVEWSVVGVELLNGAKAHDMVLGNVGMPGERGSVVLLVRYTGRPPFSLELAGLRGQADSNGATISNSDIELVTSTLAQQPGMPDVYRIPISLVVRKSLPQATQMANWLSGTDYGGKLQLDIAGLPASSAQEVSFRLHNPGQYQRYIQPFYRWWWPGVLTCPLSLFIPLAVLTLVWKRKKDADVDRLMQERRQQDTQPEEDERPSPAPPAFSGREVSAPPSTASAGEARYKRSGTLPEKRYVIPQRSSRPAATQKSSGTPASGSMGSPARKQAGENVRPPARSAMLSSHRPAGPFRPRRSK